MSEKEDFVLFYNEKKFQETYLLLKMGKRGGQRRPNKKAEAETESSVDLAAEALASMFRPIPQNMRNELNGVVEKLLHLVMFCHHICLSQMFVTTCTTLSHKYEFYQ